MTGTGGETWRKLESFWREKDTDSVIPYTGIPRGDVLFLFMIFLFLYLFKGDFALSRSKADYPISSQGS